MIQPGLTTWAAGIGAAGFSAYYSPWLWRQYRMSRIARHLQQNRVLALTYDDGPSAEVTSSLLDLLKERRAHATFFMMGSQAELYPQLADRVIAEGHEIGCHTYHHLNAWTSTPWSAIADIGAGYERLAPWIQPDTMFRPPYGKMTLPTFLATRRRNAPVWWWTIDSGDTHKNPPNSSQVVDSLRRAGGGIVLLHDTGSQQKKKFVLQVTDDLLQVAASDGFKVVTLGELQQ